jgi:hypothetical protein
MKNSGDSGAGVKQDTMNSNPRQNQNNCLARAAQPLGNAERSGGLEDSPARVGRNALLGKWLETAKSVASSAFYGFITVVKRRGLKAKIPDNLN